MDQTEKPFEKRRRLAKVDIGGRLKAARGERHMSEVVALTGLPDATLYRYEAGSMLPGADVLPLLASAYGVSLNWLLTGEGQGPAEAA